MKVIFLLIPILVVISGCASSRWVEAGENDIGTYYIDNGYTRKNASGKIVTIELIDYKKPKTGPKGEFKSLAGQYEYDCYKEERRIKHITIYSEQMGEGKMTSSPLSPEKFPWKPVTPGMGDESILLSVCSLDSAAQDKITKRQKFNDLLLMNIYYNQMFR